MRGSLCLVSTPSGLSPLYSPGSPPAASAGSLVRAHPHASVPALAIGSREETLGISNAPAISSARGPMSTARSFALATALLVARLWADQTEQQLSLPQACTSGLPALTSPRELPDMTTAPNGALRRQDLHLQVQQLVSLRPLRRVPLRAEGSMYAQARRDVRARPGPAGCPGVEWVWGRDGPPHGGGMGPPGSASPRHGLSAGRRSPAQRHKR